MNRARAVPPNTRRWVVLQEGIVLGVYLSHGSARRRAQKAEVSQGRVVVRIARPEEVR